LFGSARKEKSSPGAKEWAFDHFQEVVSAIFIKWQNDMAFLKQEITIQGESMKFQKAFKELVFSAKFEISDHVIEKLENLSMFGNDTRIDSRFMRTNTDPVRISVYRPEEMKAGLVVGVRLIKKSIKGGEHWKIVLIPDPNHADKFQEMPEENMVDSICDFMECDGSEWKKQGYTIGIPCEPEGPTVEIIRR
jgi:hypothetical protein